MPPHMLPEDIIRVQTYTLGALIAHFESALMPDHEYVKMVKVLVKGSKSLLTASKAKSAAIELVERAITSQAKSAWLGVCAKHLVGQPDVDAQLSVASQNYDYLYKTGRSRKR